MINDYTEQLHRPKEPLHRDIIQRATVRAQNIKPDYSFDVLEDGMGGCPWRIALCVILTKCATGGKYTDSRGKRVTAGDSKDSIRRTRKDVESGVKVIKNLLTNYKSPDMLAMARLDYIYRLCNIAGCSKSLVRAKAVLELSISWDEEGWVSMYDLPHCGPAVIGAVLRHAKLT